MSAIADRIGADKAVAYGLIASVLSSVLLPFLGGSPAGAYLGLFLFYLTFEFTIVSLIPLMTGVIPEARGTVMALNIASAKPGKRSGFLDSCAYFPEWILAERLDCSCGEPAGDICIGLCGGQRRPVSYSIGRSSRSLTILSITSNPPCQKSLLAMSMPASDRISVGALEPPASRILM